MQEVPQKYVTDKKIMSLMEISLDIGKIYNIIKIDIDVRNLVTSRHLLDAD